MQLLPRRMRERLEARTAALAKVRERLDARAAALDAQESALEAQAVSPLTSPDGGPIEVVTVSAHDSDRTVPDGLQTAASWAWRVLIVAALVLAIGYVLRYLSEVTIPLGVAILLTAMLLPLAHRLHAWGLSRGLATALTVLGGLAVILGGLSLIIASIAGQGATLSANVVSGFNAFLAWLQNSPLPINERWFRLEEWQQRITNFLVQSQDSITRYATEFGSSVGHFLAGIAITLFSLFYFLYDGRGIWVFVLKFFPRATRSRVDRAARRGWRSLSSYVRATILVALVDALGVLLVALILRVPLAPALAALVFLGAFIPIVGALVSGFVAVVVALVALGWVQALIMLGGIIAVMQIEGHVLQPFLLGRAVKLHPLAVIFAIAIGVIIGGIVGALLAVPILAFTKSFVQEMNYIPAEAPVVMPAEEASTG